MRASVRQCATSAPPVRRNTESECASAPYRGTGTHTHHLGAVSAPVSHSEEEGNDKHDHAFETGTQTKPNPEAVPFWLANQTGSSNLSGVL